MLKRGRFVGTFVRVLLALVLMSGCVGELLAPEEVTIRTVSCAFLDPSRQVDVVHHVAGPVPEATILVATAAWVSAVDHVSGRELDGFSWGVVAGPPGPWTREALAAWRADQDVLTGSSVRLHVLWVERLPQPGLALDELAPAFVLINATAWQAGVAAGLDGGMVARGLLFHGLGHALGVVNWSIPLHDRGGSLREEPMHHEPGGVMSAAWHHPQTFPRNVTSLYSQDVVADWQHAAIEVCP